MSLKTFYKETSPNGNYHFIKIKRELSGITIDVCNHWEGKDQYDTLHESGIITIPFEEFERMMKELRLDNSLNN